jgi:hypothetical protein
MIRIAIALAVALPMLATGSASFASFEGITSKSEPTSFDRRRPRVPGGSGCDTPRDIRQHPECRR